VFTSGNDTVRVQPDIQVHPTDIAHFVQVGFNEQINSFANHSGFHSSVIHDIYKNVSSYKDTQKMVKAMCIAVMELAKFEIQQLRIQRLRENSNSENLYERPDRAKVKMELKDSDSEDLYERPEKRPGQNPKKKKTIELASKTCTVILILLEAAFVKLW
jgi:hypothetical protein